MLIGKAGLDPVLSILALSCSSEVDWDSYGRVKHPYFSYNFATGELSSLMLSQVAKRQLSEPEATVSVPGCDVVWLTWLGYRSMESCRVDWPAARNEVANIPAEVKLPSVEEPEME